jgi:hypothetical protein
VSHSWFYLNDDYSDGWIELTAENAAAEDEPFTPVITTNLSFDAFDEASANGILLDACAAEILSLVARAEGAESALADQGRIFFLHGPTDTHKEQSERAMRAHGKREARIAELEAEVEAALRGQVEISESNGRAWETWQKERAELEAEPARIRRELLAAFAECFSTERDLNAEKVIAALDRVCPEDP